MTGKKFEIAAAGAVVAVVVVAGVLLGAWRGFPKGVDAYQHLTRLNFVADWFPHHNWFYAWAAGMPMFDNYPGLPYVAALPFVRLLGDTTTLELMALVAMAAFGLGLYGHLRLRTGRPDIAVGPPGASGDVSRSGTCTRSRPGPVRCPTRPRSGGT